MAAAKAGAEHLQSFLPPGRRSPCGARVPGNHAESRARPVRRLCKGCAGGGRGKGGGLGPRRGAACSQIGKTSRRQVPWPGALSISMPPLCAAPFHKPWPVPARSRRVVSWWRKTFQTMLAHLFIHAHSVVPHFHLQVLRKTSRRLAKRGGRQNGWPG